MTTAWFALRCARGLPHSPWASRRCCAIYLLVRTVRHSSEKLLDVAVIVVATFAIVLSSIALLKVVRSRSPRPQISSGWERYVTGAVSLVSSDGPDSIVEFSDFQCPGCAAAAAVLRTLRDENPGSLSVFFRHYPIETLHPHAFAAAAASLCAHDQANFAEYHDALFRSQREIGARTWASFAQEAGVVDLAAFDRCVADSATTSERVRSDLKMGQELGVRATPTLLVNGYPFVGVPTRRDLDSLLALSRHR